MLIRFQPSGRTLSLPSGITLYEAALAAGIPLRAPCGCKGTCGKCKLHITQGEPLGWHLACQTRISSDCTVDIPAAALENSSQQILTDSSGASASFHFKPAVQFPLTEGRNDFYGIAFDLGTTTIVGTLYDLSTGAECAVASSLNGQIPFGDDVVARIDSARRSPDSAAQMQRAAVASLNDIIASLLKTKNCILKTSPILDITLAGNTAMQQLVLGMDVTALGEIPFTPAFHAPQSLLAASIGLNVHPDAKLFVFPQIGGFVGGDTVAGILAAGLDRVESPTLFMDIGTNGEIVLALPGGKLLATSAAAGPAFEGARISQGMRATTGAIDKIRFEDGAFHFTTIGNAPPIGLCGTALIDAVAECLHYHLVDVTGLIASPDEWERDYGTTGLQDGTTGEREGTMGEREVKFPSIGGVPVHTPPFPSVGGVPEGRGGSSFLLIPDGDNVAIALTPTVRLIQRDIRELQLASGALRAAAEMLLQRAGLTAADLDAVLLAGAFGNYIRRENALRIGLFPAVPVEKVKFIGNAASHGARMALLSTDERDRAATAARTAEHVELGADPDFQNAFAMAMMFPEEELQ